MLGSQLGELGDEQLKIRSSQWGEGEGKEKEMGNAEASALVCATLSLPLVFSP
jgi:hypothetical protein